jgi:transposase
MRETRNVSPRATIGDAVATQPGFRALTRAEQVNRPDRGHIEQPGERSDAQPEAPSERKRRVVVTDEKIKMAAAERVLIGGAKRSDVAASLDVSPNVIGSWIEEYRKKAASGQVLPTSALGARELPKLEIRFDGVRIDGLEEYIEALVDARVEARVSAAVKSELRKRLAGD